MRRQPRALNLHSCLKWVDQGVVYRFDYPEYSVIQLASNRGSRLLYRGKVIFHISRGLFPQQDVKKYYQTARPPFVFVF